MEAASAALSGEQKRAFVRDGYVVIRKVVPARLTGAALKHVNAKIGELLETREAQAWEEDLGDGGGDGSSALEVVRDSGIAGHPAIKALLLDSPARGYVESLLGPGGSTHSGNVGGQVRPNFPCYPSEKEAQRVSRQWHVDGGNKGRIYPFRVLVGVMLSDQPTAQHGGLAVYPGSHRFVGDWWAQCARAHPDQWPPPCSAANFKTFREQGLALDSEPVPLVGEKGDLILAHHHLAHRMNLNTSPDIRYQVYFRVSNKKSRPRVMKNDRASYLDMWHDFPGLEGFVPK